MSHVVLILCYGFILWLIFKDIAWRKAGSKALLIPGAWIAIQGSRPVSYWFGGGGGSEANPINTFVFAVLIGSALIILKNRGLNWGEFIRNNKAVFLIYFYLLISVVWSEVPGVSAKRLFKDFGCVMVGLVLLTEVRPVVAIRAIFVRVAYILFPLSVVFIKFFPNIGRSFSRAGEAMFGGVTTQKNSLGEMVFVLSVVMLWDLVEILREKNRPGKKVQIIIRGGILLQGLWLLELCDSQTSMLCLIIGTCIFFGSERLLKMRNGKSVLISVLVGIVLLVVMDKTFELSDKVIRALGRDPSLTGRTDIWRIILGQKTDRLLGEGFYIFWDSSKGEAVGDAFMHINSSHNGYLDMYLDGGLVGNTLLVILLLAMGRRVIDRLFSGHPLGKLGLIFWFLAILYNFSESSFFRLDVLWFSFLLVTVECPRWSHQSVVGQRTGVNPSQHRSRKSGNSGHGSNR